MKAVIFDFNGTLFWDNDKNFDAWIQESANLRGTPLSDEEMLKLNGLPNRVFLEYIAGRSITEDEYWKWTEDKEVIYRKLCKEDTKNFHLAPGAVELFDFLSEKNIPMGIASMAGEGNFNFYYENFGILKWFKKEHIVYDDGKIPGKPDPTIYILAAKRLNIDPKDCVVVEDSTHGIESAKNAGIGMIYSLRRDDFPQLKEKYGVVGNINTFYDFDRSIFG